MQLKHHGKLSISLNSLEMKHRWTIKRKKRTARPSWHFFNHQKLQQGSSGKKLKGPRQRGDKRKRWYLPKLHARNTRSLLLLESRPLTNRELKYWSNRTRLVPKRKAPYKFSKKRMRIMIWESKRKTQLTRKYFHMKSFLKALRKVRKGMMSQLMSTTKQMKITFQ